MNGSWINLTPGPEMAGFPATLVILVASLVFSLLLWGENVKGIGWKWKVFICWGWAAYMIYFWIRAVGIIR